jgi:hypothetical protein
MRNTARAVAGLTGRSGTLMGGGAGGVPFVLLGPLGTVVLSDRPFFRWQPLQGASGYKAAVYDPDFNRTVFSGLLTGTQWQATTPLWRGVTYHWLVTAIKDGSEIKSPAPPAPEAKFRVLERAKFEEIEQARRAYAGSHLVTGLFYARMGLLEEAEGEFQLLANSNPNSVIPAKLLQRVRAFRRR